MAILVQRPAFPVDMTREAAAARESQTDGRPGHSPERLCDPALDPPPALREGRRARRTVAGQTGRSEAEVLSAEILPLADACRFLEREAPRILATRRCGDAGTSHLAGPGGLRGPARAAGPGADPRPLELPALPARRPGPAGASSRATACSGSRAGAGSPRRGRSPISPSSPVSTGSSSRCCRTPSKLESRPWRPGRTRSCSPARRPPAAQSGRSRRRLGARDRRAVRRRRPVRPARRRPREGRQGDPFRPGAQRRRHLHRAAPDLRPARACARAGEAGGEAPGGLFHSRGRRRGKPWLPRPALPMPWEPRSSDRRTPPAPWPGGCAPGW